MEEQEQEKEIVFKCGHCHLEFPVIEFDNVGSYTLDKSKLNDMVYLKEKIDVENTCCIDCAYPSLNSCLEERVCKQEEVCFNVKQYELEIWDILALSFGKEELELSQLQRICKILNELPEEKQEWILNGDRTDSD